MDVETPVGHAFVDAIGRRDFAALEAVFHPNIDFRALVPGEAVTTTGAAGAIACFRRWFGDKTDIEIVDREVALLVDTLRVGYRARLKKAGEPLVVAQTCCGHVEGGQFATLDLLCTGFRPELAVVSGTTTHVFDAGDLGCGSGLPREFRTRLAQIPVGHVLEVVTNEPAAREDLPSLARMLGHQVRAVEADTDGKLRIRVERTR
jgi:TusA-related sulfurtransferase/ketosteroid isomerase-like protein